MRDIENCIYSVNSRICLLLSMEDAEVLEDPYDLVIFKRLDLRGIGITWNFDNKWESGCLTKKDRGLSHNGEELVMIANKLGIILDIVHASKRTMIDVLKAFKKPVIISHANVRKTR